VTDSDDVTDAAFRLVAAAKWGEPCDPVRDLIAEDDLVTAYAVQALVSRHRQERGHRVVGRKIGPSSCFGTLFDDMAYGDREPIALDTLLQPRVEAEVAFVLGRDLDMERPTVSDVIRAIEFVLPAIEVVDSRIFDWDTTAADAIADNACSGAFVLGSTPRALREVELVGAGLELESCGYGNLGNPVVAVTRLARTLAAAGTMLRAGDVILSGAVGPVVPVRGPGSFHARIAGLGAVTATFVAGEAA
jgi:2-keto-4-pentenoate hydratase